jgi:hypothetical protein
MLPDVVDRDHVRVRGQRPGGARFALEALDELRLGRELLGEDLDRHVPPEQGVLSQPDRGHPANGELADNAVALRQQRIAGGGSSSLLGLRRIHGASACAYP